MVEYLSFGGGPPSVALMILNAWGEIQPKAELILFADTGLIAKHRVKLINATKAKECSPPERSTRFVRHGLDQIR